MEKVNDLLQIYFCDCGDSNVPRECRPMKRSEAIAVIQAAIVRNDTAEQILNLLMEAGMNEPGDAGGESELGWESEQPIENKVVMGPDTLSDFVMKRLITKIEKDLYGDET